MHWTDEQLSAYVDGELPRDEAAALRAHLDECGACRAEVRLLESVGEAMRSTAVEPSAGFEADTLARLRSLPMPRRSWRSLLGLDRPWMPVFATAALLVVALVGVRPWESTPPAPVQSAHLDDADVAEHVEFLQDMELLEDLDVVESLDQVPG